MVVTPLLVFIVVLVSFSARGLMLMWVMTVACGLKLTLYQSTGESVGRTHVPYCGYPQEKVWGSVCVLGRECGQIMKFGGCDQNGPALLFHGCLDSPWKSLEFRKASCGPASPGALVSPESCMQRNPPLDSRNWDVVIHSTGESTEGAF